VAEAMDSPRGWICRRRVAFQTLIFSAPLHHADREKHICRRVVHFSRRNTAIPFFRLDQARRATLGPTNDAHGVKPFSCRASVSAATWRGNPIMALTGGSISATFTRPTTESARKVQSQAADLSHYIHTHRNTPHAHTATPKDVRLRGFGLTSTRFFSADQGDGDNISVLESLRGLRNVRFTQGRDKHSPTGRHGERPHHVMLLRSLRLLQ